MRMYIMVTWELCDPLILQNLRIASAIKTTERTTIAHSTNMLTLLLMVAKQKYCFASYYIDYSIIYLK
jgi:hypothetical protein